ncbi:MAG: tetratricopeptide repeat protein [Pirellulales bacterium]
MNFARDAWRMLPLVALLALAGCGRGASTPVETGQELLQSGDYDAAITTLDEAIRLNPRDAQAYVFRGRAYHCRDQAGDLNAAIEDFSAAIQLNPKDPEAYYSRSIAYHDRGLSTRSPADEEKSQADHAAARRLDPGVTANLEILPDPVAEHSDKPAPTAAATTDLESAEPEQRESASDVVRRLEAEARAAERDAAGGDTAKPNERSRITRRLSAATEAEANRAAAIAERKARAEAAARGLSSAEGGAAAPARERPRRRLNDPTGTAHASPELEGGAAGGQELPGAITPRGTAAPYRGGGTLPPVATSPFSTPSPYSSPLDEAISPRAGGAIAASPYQNPYPSPFPQRAPSPTGYVEPQPGIQAGVQTGVPAAAGQSRPYYTPVPRFKTHPDTIQHFDYNP